MRTLLNLYAERMPQIAENPITLNLYVIPCTSMRLETILTEIGSCAESMYANEKESG